ncbi:hypothetical protein MKK68_02125 [Methylobacterium sp. E-016]|uniref:hypothetical protein n=1 Tax=Methylobacterium sp. E-016 TaxID=2836556 RepID=UPI001FBB0AC9|nr:hypothetical protein [Methylobacterium sp. E-016]MCJ2074458.1 hypothetical protein [Methylobacterium sp. E-016]
MKTVLTAFAISSLIVAPASASGTLRVKPAPGNPEPVRIAAVVDVVPAPAAQAASAKKVRVVLASPYGN